MRKLSEIILQPNGIIDLTKLPIDEEFEYDSLIIKTEPDEFSNHMLNYIKSIGCVITSIKKPGLYLPSAIITKISPDYPEKDRVMDFSQALVELKAGKKVAREGWNGIRILVIHKAVDKENDGHDYSASAAVC